MKLPVPDESGRYVIVSSDSHAGAPLLDYKQYLEGRWHDEFDAWAAAYEDPWEQLEGEDRNAGAASGALDGNWDSELRQSQVESEGIVGEVLFPNTVPPFFPAGGLLTNPSPATKEEYELRSIGIRAHNRWLVDFCSMVPGRRVGVAQVFLNDVEDAMDEVRWVKEVGLGGGIMIPGTPEGDVVPGLKDPRYDPLWALCAELDVPVHQHSSGSAIPSVYALHKDGHDPTDGAIAAYELQFWNHRSLWHLILGGVFERHPGLKFVLTEQGAVWVTAELAKMDGLIRATRKPGHVMHRVCKGIHEKLALLPSEYFARNCYLGASAGFSSVEAEARHRIGLDRIMWGSDYPHNEGTYPYNREALRGAFAGVPTDEAQAILAGNAVEVYGFGVTELVEAAGRVGLTVAEVAEPLPDDAGGDTRAPAMMA